MKLIHIQKNNFKTLFKMIFQTIKIKMDKKDHNLVNASLGKDLKNKRNHPTDQPKDLMI